MVFDSWVISEQTYDKLRVGSDVYDEVKHYSGFKIIIDKAMPDDKIFMMKNGEPVGMIELK